MDRFADFLRRQIGTDLEKLRTMREDAEVGNSEMYPPNVFRGFRECEVKTRLLCMHEKCGTGNGPCDVIGQAFPLPDERGCQTRAILGMIYSDRPGYQARWQP